VKTCVCLVALSIAPLLAAPAQAADVSGDWKIDGEISGYTVNSVCTLKQQDNKLTGECKSDQNDSPLKGEVDGQKVTWQYDVDYNGEKYTLQWTATLESDTAMKGTISAGGGEGAFTAKKQ
jgi:hypothetical protein